MRWIKFLKLTTSTASTSFTATDTRLLLKTNRGPHILAFASKADGEAFLRWKPAPASVDTLGDILRINPDFPTKGRALYFPSREAMQLFANDPATFPTEKYLFEFVREEAPPVQPQAEDDPRQRKFEV